MNTRSFFILSLICICYAPLSLNASARSSFEEAYRIENEDPERAASLYERALSSGGLDERLTQAARWRLFYLYRRQKVYPRALEVLNQLGSGRDINRIRSDLTREIRRSWRISEEGLDAYLRGHRMLSSSQRNSALSEYRTAYRESSSERFRQLLIEELTDAGLGRQALSLIQEGRSGSQAEKKLAEADMLFRMEEIEEGKDLLLNLAETTNLRNDEKFRLLYLLGRFYRAEDDHYNAVTYFRLAANYSSNEDRRRQIALAAFSLYQQDLPRQAYSLIKEFPESDDSNIELMILLLRVEIEGDASARRALMQRRQEFAAGSRADAPFLIRKAYQITLREARP